MRFLPAGPSAILIEVADLDQVLALHAEVTRRRAEGWAPYLVDVVPGGRTLLLDGVEDVAGLIADLESWTIPLAATLTGEVVEIPCCYDGPDLEAVATQWAVSVSEVVEVHTSILHTVAFCGFSPGFAYLAGLGEKRVVIRRSSPRTSVPPGSVALGGTYTGIYPRSSPGGWQLIGRTDAVLWDPCRDPVALLRPGCRVRFIIVDL